MKIYLSLIFIYFSINTFCQSGTIDNSFNSQGNCEPTQSIKNIIKLENNKLIISGHFDYFDGTNNYKGIARLNQDGYVENTFEVDFLPSSSHSFSGLHSDLQTDGKILYVVRYYYASNYYTKFVRLNPNGSLDSSFDHPFTTNASDIFDLLVKGNKIYVAGRFNVPNQYLVRLNLDGTIDNSFNLSTAITNNITSIRKVISLASGKLLLLGHSDNDAYILYRINENGSLDTSFNSLVFEGTIKSLHESVNNKIYLGGRFSDHSYIVRLNEDGLIDNTFAPYFNGSHTFSRVNDLLPVANGLIAVGNFTKVNGYDKKSIVLLDEMGAVDNTFDVGGGIYSQSAASVEKIIRQFDDKIVISGDFTAYNFRAACGITRINFVENLDTYNYLQDNHRIYPNPTKDFLFINNLNLATNEIEIFDLTGKLVLKRNPVNENNILLIDLRELSNGIYLGRIGDKTFRFIKN